ncbi:unnamed protein product [Rodentolepis nana]|uniref:XPG_I_2 domain-containing protein n=1 Tax=Rodentolepis nana TaxID=102285 RepID=A0A0R3TL69_RODNA|nr:unnamed protein product [Rodentolepis nana]
MHGDFFPSLRTFSLNCLRNLGIPFVVAEYDWLPSCLAIALLLDCPIAAFSSDWFVCSKPISIPDVFPSLTLNDLKIVNLQDKFYTVERENGRDRVMLNVFRPENSPLKSVPVGSRILIALLMNQHIVPKLPSAVKVEQRDNESFTAAKLRAVIDYVSRTIPIYVLKDVIELYVDSGRADHTSKMILSYLERFCPDFSMGSQLLSILGLNQGLPAIEPPSSKNRRFQKREDLSPSDFFKLSTKLLKGIGHEDMPLDFFYLWPVGLIHLYRSGYLDKFYVAALYNDLGVTFEAGNEYLVELPHCFGPSRVLRGIIYSLLVGVDEANGARFKLVGLKPGVKELCYEGLFRYKTYKVHVQPAYLPANCLSEDFIHTVIGFTSSSDIPEWCEPLVVSCLLWHQQKPQHKSCQIRECPLIISTLLLALITHQTPEADLPALADHLDNMKAAVMTELTQSDALPSPALEKELLHGALELANLYTSYISLYNLLTVLRSPNLKPEFQSPAYNRFPHISIAFPSLELLVGIASHLRSQEFPYNVALRKWLVRAFRPVVNDISAVKALQLAVTAFSSLMQRISTMKLAFQEPEVDISDPPNILRPKEERASKSAPSSKEKSTKIIVESLPNSRHRDNLNKPRNLGGGGKGRGERPKKSGSYADRLAKRCENMNLNAP